MADGLEKAIEKMRADGAPDVAIANFRHYYELLAGGDTGTIAEDEIEPAGDLPSADELPEPGDEGRQALERAVVIRLNGGLGTSMGMTGPKALLEVKDGLNFLDVIARQVLRMRERHGIKLPLVLMDSFRTREESLKALEPYPDLDVGEPLDFLQGRVPKILADSLEPAEWPDDPELEWAPPGHGDLYTSLVTSGTLEQLIEDGYEYAFVANSDNLGAVLEPRILAWFARQQLPFAMEVLRRSESDRKGGHIARRKGGGLVLRESAQVRDEDAGAFQDISRHRFFNSNNLWLNLRTLARVLDDRDGVLGLPMIVNRKTLDPGDASSPAVYQLETAMGAAIDVFEGAAAIEVGRARFAPVKTTNDLLVVRSDAYELTAEAEMRLVRDEPPLVDLDSEHYKLVRDFDAHFPAGPPSLKDCDRLEVDGDVVFGAGVVVRGSVRIEGDRRIEGGAVLEG
ncbi:MAG TPA: UTP--glucose-1-phosphate uridylyltransferase [Thermoleophilaceae bacterium]|nr:UTP--glucose-1-phosphate uridylyltransferase [Thermoleophilaceae bacterium]